MHDNIPFPRLVYGSINIARKIWSAVRKHLFVIILSLVLVGALMSGSYILGLRKGYDDGYGHSLSASGLLELSLNMGRLSFLEQENDESLKYSLELGVDISLGDIFYGVALDPEPWYVNTSSTEKQTKREKSWGGVLEETALYRSEHPGSTIKPGDVVYQRLMEYLLTQPMDSLDSGSTESP